MMMDVTGKDWVDENLDGKYERGSCWLPEDDGTSCEDIVYRPKNPPR